MIKVEVSAIFRCQKLPLTFMIDQSGVSGPSSYTTIILDEEEHKIIGSKTNSTEEIKKSLWLRFKAKAQNERTSQALSGSGSEPAEPSATPNTNSTSSDLLCSISS